LCGKCGFIEDGLQSPRREENIIALCS